MTKSTRRPPKQKRKPNKFGFVNFGGESKSDTTDLGRKFLAEFEKRKGKP